MSGRLPIYLRRRYDPKRLDAVVRSASGRTRCPECDTLNPADQKYCDECGAALYPEWSADQSARGRGLIDLLIQEKQSDTEGTEEYGVETEEAPRPLPAESRPALRIVDCPRCHAPNPANNSYCGKCGSRLHPAVYSDSVPPADVKDIDKPLFYK